MPKAKPGNKQRRAKFDYSLDYKNLDLRSSPHLYRIGLGEQGVLSVEPYKSEILPLWRFKTPEIAEISSQDLKKKFEKYKQEKDFIGMDMTRKFIQMGVTRARRYANWAGGKKYTGKLDEQGKKITVTKGPEDEVKAESARIFGVVLKEVQADEDYLQYAREHKEKYENHFKVEKHEDDDEDVLTPVRKRRSEREIKVKVKDESSSD